ncbi:hypothetical protein REPUB_Repub02eG0020100 [Reevesia pubescens]
MIRFILLQNRQGKTRLAKYYVPLEESEKHKVEYEVHRLVVNRDPKFTNFVEFRTHKVIYRRYAGLFFSLCVDITDNELAYLECIHLFVEILDHFFSNVCELDLVFNFHKVYLILDEFILAGELQETSKKVRNFMETFNNNSMSMVVWLILSTLQLFSFFRSHLFLPHLLWFVIYFSIIIITLQIVSCSSGTVITFLNFHSCFACLYQNFLRHVVFENDGNNISFNQNVPFSCYEAMKIFDGFETSTEVILIAPCRLS